MVFSSTKKAKTAKELSKLKSRENKVDPKTFNSMVDIAYNNADRLLLLILDIEKIESGNMEFTDINMNDLIESCIKQNIGLAEKHQVNFDFNKDNYLPTILADNK